jgi:hypothetical protein
MIDSRQFKFPRADPYRALPESLRDAVTHVSIGRFLRG